MALAGWEWIIVAGVLIVFFLWGPNKIPQLARAVGQAKKEFDTASKQLSNPLEAVVSGQGSESASNLPSAPVAQSADDTLITTAKKLGIATEGKTRDEISNEIVQEANARSSPPAPPASTKTAKT